MTTGHSGRRVNAAPSKSLGEKRRRINDEQIDAITRLHGEFTEGEVVTLRGVSSVIRQLLSSSTPKGASSGIPSGAIRITCR